MINHQVFTQDFNIAPNFVVLEKRANLWPPQFDEGLETQHAMIHAYLARPISSGPIFHKRGEYYSSAAVDHTLDPKVLASEASLNPQDLFREAKRALRLGAPHIFIEVQDEVPWPEYEFARDDRVVTDGRSPRHPEEGDEEQPVKMRNHCIDCDEWPCRAPGGKEVKEYAFKMFGAAEPEHIKWRRRFDSSDSEETSDGDDDD